MAKNAQPRAQVTLSRDAIVRSALAIADSEGLEAVTIRRVSINSGVTPMALYNHFPGKGELLDGIAESILSGVDLPQRTGESWDQDLFEVLRAFLAALLPHPAVAELVPDRILHSDAGLTLAERVIGLLREAGFSLNVAAAIACYLPAATITLVTAEPGPRRSLDGAERDAAIRMKRALLGALAPDRFPNVIASADALARCSEEQAYYECGLHVLVSGLRAITPPADSGDSAPWCR